MSAALALLMLCLFAATAGAQDMQMQVYFARDALDAKTAQRLIELMAREFPQAQWTALLEEETGKSLREMIFSDQAPQMAVCAPGEAYVFAKEGIIVPLERHIADVKLMQRQVIDACTYNEHLYMAPLVARHRQMAVNRRMLEREHLGYMISAKEHPVWFPTEFDQILEEFALSGEPAMEIWPARVQDCAALEAFLQAIYGGTLLSEDGVICQADNASTLAGLCWLRDRVKGEMVSVAKSRGNALQNFIKGETAIFIDWLPGDGTTYARTLQQNGVELVTMPYPSSSGLPIRAYELTGMCVLAGEDAEQMTLGMEAAAFVCEDAQAQIVLGDRAIWQDSAVWLPLMNANDRGATLRSLFCGVIEGVLSGEAQPKEALSVLNAAMRAME